MKTLLIIAGFLIVQTVLAQSALFEKTYPFTDQLLDVDMELGTELTVKSWSRKEISVKITYQVNDGKDNEALRIDVDDYKNRLSLDVELDKTKLRDLDDCCCQTGQRGRWDNGRNSCVEIKVEVMIPSTAEIRVQTVTADVTIEGMVSDIDVETVTGVIDLTWQDKAGAEISLKTVTGSLYTNMEIETKRDKGLPGISSRNVKGTFKDGEKEVRLESVTGAIYFRKSGS
jgi:hypothetical protein